MNIRMLTLLLGLATVVLTGCSTVKVQTDFDRSADFAQYHTYVLTAARDELKLAPSGEAALRDTLRAQLAARGINEVTGATPDLEVVEQVFTRDGVSVQQYGTWGYNYGGRWPARYGTYGMWAGAPMAYTDIREYTTGTLILDFVDAKSRKLVFRGTGTGTVGSPQANADSIEAAVLKIFRDFPKAVSP